MSNIVIPESWYPLRWPAGRPRTTARRTSAFAKAQARPDEVHAELKRIPDVRTIILSSNMPLRADGTAYSGSNQTPDGDPGVVAYWTRVEFRAGRSQLVPYCLPMDRWNRIACNLRALTLSIASMRGMERWGAVSIEEAFAAYAALPAGSGESYGARLIRETRPWREVLGGNWPTDLDREGLLAVAKQRYRKAAAAVHPDHSGAGDEATALNAAMSEAERELTT